MAEQLIKSKERVQKFAEVFTPSHVVKKMVSLVDSNFDDEDYGYKTWFDPAVGTGNFPAEILERKLHWCHKHDLSDWERLQVLATIYAVDIQKDNVEETRERLLQIFKKHLIDSTDIEIITIAKSILEANIVIGDTINHPEDILFLQYHPSVFPIPIAEYRLSEMLGEEAMNGLKKRRAKRKKKSVI